MSTIASTVARRKWLLLKGAAYFRQWDADFPVHDPVTWRLLPEDPPPHPLTTEPWRQAAREYHAVRGNRVLIVETPPEKLARLRRLLRDDVSFAAAFNELNDSRNFPTPQVVIEAIWHSVREQ